MPHSPPRIVGRIVSGRPLDGVARTDATFLRAGHRVLHPHNLRRWAMLAGWQRAGIRLGVPAATYAAGYAYGTHPQVTLGLAGAVGTMAAFHGVRRARRWWRMRRFRNTYVIPTLAALRGALGDAKAQLHVSPDLGNLVPRLAKAMSPFERRMRVKYTLRVEPVLRWAPDRVQRGLWLAQRAATPLTRHLDQFRRPTESAGPRVELVASVPYLTTEQCTYVSAVVKAKIPAGDLVERWNQVGTQVTVTWTVRRRPPARVGYAHLDARLSALKELEFFVGLTVGDDPVVISLHDDSPHIALSAGSGAGKSVLARVVAVQVLARGGWVVILDRKGSHRWALGLPGVVYCTRPAQMHDMLLTLAKLADERNTLAFHEDEGWDPGPRVLVIAEELNATFTQLRDYWAETRPRGAQPVSPAVKAFRELLFMGRSAKVNVLAVAQMLTANTTGGPESRENFGVRCLARYTRNNWKMLVPEAGMPRASRTLGRWQVVVGGTAKETQVCFLSDDEARFMVNKMSPTGPCPGDIPWSGPIKGERASGDMPVSAQPLREHVTLREATERGLVPGKYDAAKKRLQRARKDGVATAPSPVGKDGNADLYLVDDLIVWVQSELVS